MNLGKNIYNLLKRQAEVYVDGLGSFKRNHTPATYDEKRNVYLPPITYIDFDRKSKEGYDFVQYIQQLHLSDRGEAKLEVENQVQDVLRRIAEEGQVKLDDLGHLVAYGDSYVFKALDLSGFHFEPVEAIAGQPQANGAIEEPETGLSDALETTVEPEEVSADEEVPVAETDVVETETVLVSEPEPVLPEEEPKRSNVLWYVLSAVVLLGIIGGLYWTNRAPATGSNTSTDGGTTQQEKPADTSGSTVLAGAAADTLGKNAPQPTTMSVAEKQPLVPENHTWQIVIGSHKTLAQAYEQAESYNKAGFDRVRVIPSNLAKNRKKVIWDSYETKAEVDSALQYVRKHHIPDAWPDKIK